MTLEMFDDSSSTNTSQAMEEGENDTPMSIDEPPPRLMITKMTLENFKSYAGIKEVGPFHKCFSAVVGPNGSGKSNVIDAMLFVFGKRAKKLRLNKVSELIHMSDAVKDDPPQFARVSVHFQEIIDTGSGDEDYKVVPNTEVIVSRTAKKDSSSSYKLNGKNSSFKEIAVYLNSKGIDLDNNRFLILQGEVEMISMMPPKGKTENDEGLLEYLEDIIGSSKFVEATNQAAEKVEALTEVRQEKLNRVKVVEKEKNNLEGAKQEAEALLAKEREIRRKQNILYQIHAMRADLECKRLSQKKDDVTVRLEEHREQTAQANARIAEIDASLSEQRQDYQKTFEELKRTKEEFAVFERKDIKLREELKHERAQKKKLMDRIKSEEKKEVTAASKCEKALENIPVFEEKIKELSQRRHDEDVKLEAIEEETKEVTQKIRRQLEAKTQELAPVKQERAVLQAEFDTAEAELKILEDSTNRAKERLQSAETELATLDDTQMEKRNALTQTEKEMENAKASIRKLEGEDAELASNEEKLGARHNDIVAQLEDVRSAMRASGGQSRSKAVQGILKAARKGGELSNVGILGRLGDLATIPEKYDVAVSTSCGGMLDNIVVHTTAGAQRCLEFLRKYNLGRASFIPLDKQKKGAHDRAVETPENAPRLFDLITPSNFAVTPAIYLAVGNTLVAPDMDTATRWAYESSKRWRVVTLTGSLIETTGTMSGGGKTARRGGMLLANSRSKVPTPSSEDESEQLINSLEEKAKQTSNLLQEHRERRLQIKNEIRAFAKVIKTCEIKMPKLALEINGCDTTRKELTKLIPDLRVQCELSPEDQQKRAGLAKNVEKCKANMASCTKLAEKLEVEVSKLQKEILDAGGPRLKKQKAACEQVITELNAAEKSLNSSKVDAASAGKAVEKAKASKLSLEAELLSCEQSLQQKEVDFKSLESGALQVMTAYEQVKVVEAEKRAALELASKEMDELKKTHSDSRGIEVDLVGQLDSLAKSISDSKKKLQSWVKEIERLQKADDDLDFDDENEVAEYEDADASDANDDQENNVRNLEGSNEGLAEKAEQSKTQDHNAKSFSSLPYTVLEKYDPEEVKETIATLEAERNILAKNANMGAIAEYRKKEADYLARVGELDQVTEERNDARKEHEELRRQRLEMFMDGFGVITLKLKEMYQMITLGGDAELELVDSLDPFSEGIVFSVRPPKKSWKNISNLSGGEKTLSSLSLVFALHHYKPTPLYVMDEIDAALDFKNVSIVANYIKERTKNAQFVIISLRNNMFELADRLVGIYKTSNCTKSVTINPKAFGALSQQNGASQAPAALSDSTNSSFHATKDRLRLAANQ